MRNHDLPALKQARRARQKDKARAALLDEAKVEELARLEFEAAKAKTGKSKKRQRAIADQMQA